MRVDARTLPDCWLWRLYDHPFGGFRKDVVWADDVTNELGTGPSFLPLKVEKRKRVIIIPPLKWIAVDVPEDEEKITVVRVQGTPMSEEDRRKLIEELNKVLEGGKVR